MKENERSDRDPSPRPDGTGPEWTVPAAEAKRVFLDRMAAGRATWADHLLAQVFETLASTDDEELITNLGALDGIVTEWSWRVRERQP